MIIATVTGYLGADPEVRTMENGENYVTFSVGSTTGNNETTWVSCVAFNRSSEIIDQYLRKGDKVTIIGDMSLESYVNRDGNKGASLNMKVLRLELPPKAQQEENTAKPTAKYRGTR